MGKLVVISLAGVTVGLAGALGFSYWRQYINQPPVIKVSEKPLSVEMDQPIEKLVAQPVEQNLVQEEENIFGKSEKKI